MNLKKFLMFFLFFVILVIGINIFRDGNSNASSDKIATQETIQVELPSDFVIFYERFHTDSVYQMKHIVFPLEGLPAMIDSTFDINNFKWSVANWNLHKTYNNYDGTYIREFDNFNGLITQRIYDTGHRFEMRTRYSKLGEEWYLIYYAAMNPTEIYR